MGSLRWCMRLGRLDEARPLVRYYHLDSWVMAAREIIL
jgi:hypothetical protein